MLKKENSDISRMNKVVIVREKSCNSGHLSFYSRDIRRSVACVKMRNVENLVKSHK